MKLTKAEKIILVLTLLFLAFTLGVHWGDDERDSFTISTKARTEDPAAGENQSKLVNINTAGKEELMTLSGIGRVLAGRIIAYRSEHGPFSHIDEITKVDGIGNGLYSRICTAITVE